MRYYRIEVGGQVFTSQPTAGTTDMGALNIEIDATVYAADEPQGFSTVTIWGVPLSLISQASNFQNADIKIFAGMAAGLPLATSAFNAGQQGLIQQGTVFQSFGNWINTDQYLAFLVTPDGGFSKTNPGNFSYAWQTGDNLSDKIRAVLSAVYPDKQITMNISANLVLTEAEGSAFYDAHGFATAMRSLSQSIITDKTYPGVSIVFNGDKIQVFDGTQNTSVNAPLAANPQSASAAGAKAIRFQDMIGQPTWTAPNSLQWNAMMRADLSPGQVITLPQGPQVHSGAEVSNQAADSSAFTGPSTISSIRHVGNFRDSAAESWLTVVDCYLSGGNPS